MSSELRRRERELGAITILGIVFIIFKLCFDTRYSRFYARLLAVKLNLIETASSRITKWQSSLRKNNSSPRLEKETFYGNQSNYTKWQRTIKQVFNEWWKPSLDYPID